VKLYEYVGASRPVIASRGTLAGEFVEQQGIGWAVDYGADPIAALLQSLLDKPAVLQAPTEATHRIRREHTWQARARQVADDLAEAR
jgi:glycosyltransferase involved in cell wall biosynthesis